MKTFMSGIMVLVLVLTSVGCQTTTSNLVTTLNAVSDSTNIAVVVASSLVAFGKLDPAVGTQVSDYAVSVNAAVNASIVELNSTKPNPQKILAITAAFAKIATPAFGANDQQAKAMIDAITITIKIFLNNLQSAGILKAATAAPNAPIKLEAGDKKLLKSIQAKIADTLAKAKLLKETS